MRRRLPTIFAATFRRFRRHNRGLLSRRTVKLDAMNSYDLIRYSLLSLSASLLLLATALAQTDNGNASSTINIPKPPSTKQQPVTDDYFGTKIVDPYRWLEDGSSAEEQRWVGEQLAYTRSILDRLPGRDKLHDRIEQLLEIGNLGETAVGGEFYFHPRREGKQNQPVLYVRKHVDGKDEVLVDANQRSKERRVGKECR